MRGTLRTCIYRVVWYVNVSLMSLILVAYLQDNGLWNQCFLGFCSDFCQYNWFPSPLAMCLASKGSALGLLAVHLCQFNKHLLWITMVVHNIEKADYLVCTPNAKICIALYTLHTRVRLLWVMGISEKIGGRKTEAEPKSHINYLQPMAVIFGLKTFCSRKSDSPYLHIFEQHNDC